MRVTGPAVLATEAGAHDNPAPAPAGDTITDLTIYRRTGTASVRGTIGASAAVDIAVDCDGSLFGHDVSLDQILDPAAGAPTLVGNTGIDASFPQGMDFDNSDGTLYAWIHQAAGTGQFARSTWRPARPRHAKSRRPLAFDLLRAAAALLVLTGLIEGTPSQIHEPTLPTAEDRLRARDRRPPPRATRSAPAVDRDGQTPPPRPTMAAPRTRTSSRRKSFRAGDHGKAKGHGPKKHEHGRD